MADLARGILVAAIVLETGVLAFHALVLAPAREAAGRRPAAAGPLHAVLIAGATLAAAAALAGLAAGAGHGREQAGWVLAAIAATLVLGLVLAGADAAASAPSPRSWLLAAAALALLLVPALLGNAGTASPGLVIPANVLHVTAAAIWTGGIAGLLAIATAGDGGSDETRFLASAVGRFSGIALLAVLAIAFSGLLEGLVLVRRVDALVTTGYGRLIAIKALLLCGLAALGAVQRGRTLPELHDAASGTGDPAAARGLLRTVLRAEAALLVLVLLATGVLASTTPSRAAGHGAASRAFAAGPFSVRARVTPASPGDNRITLVVRAAAGGGGAVRAITRVVVSERQPKLGIGPLRQVAARTGPGRFTVRAAPLGAPGTWSVTVAVVSGGRTRTGAFTVRLR